MTSQPVERTTGGPHTGTQVGTSGWHERTRSSGGMALIGANLLLIAVYFASGKLGLSLAFVNASASAVWPPTGVALAALLLFGWRLWPAVFIGAFLVNITTQVSLTTTPAVATSNTLAAHLVLL